MNILHTRTPHALTTELRWVAISADWCAFQHLAGRKWYRGPPAISFARGKFRAVNKQLFLSIVVNILCSTEGDLGWKTPPPLPALPESSSCDQSYWEPFSPRHLQWALRTSPLTLMSVHTDTHVHTHDHTPLSQIGPTTSCTYPTQHSYTKRWQNKCQKVSEALLFVFLCIMNKVLKGIYF